MASPFLAWLGAPAGRRWLDVGCGTGALSAAIIHQCSPAAVTGVEPSEGFLATARANLGAQTELKQGSATAIPLADAAVDVVVSGLVLNFVSEPREAIKEMVRVTAPGGVIAAYVWDYGGKMELMRIFWDAAVALEPNAVSLDEGVRFPLCRPEALKTVFTEAGLADVRTTTIDIDTPFSDFDDYWLPFEGGQGPAPAYAMSLGDAARARLRERVRERLPISMDGAIALTARAWAVRGVVRAA